jgi:hypothetical protein
MQTRLKIALAATAFALTTIPAFAAEMPTDGSKNFSAPSDAPSYFTNEAVPEPARVDRAATFTGEDVAASPDAESASPVTAEPERHSTYASAHKSTRHTAGKSKGHNGSRGYAKSTSSKATRTAALHTEAKSTNAGSRSASAAKASAKTGSPAGGARTTTPRHAKTGTGQHAEMLLQVERRLVPA